MVCRDWVALKEGSSTATAAGVMLPSRTRVCPVPVLTHGGAMENIYSSFYFLFMGNGSHQDLLFTVKIIKAYPLFYFKDQMISINAWCMWWWWLCLACEDFGGRFDDSFPFCAYFEKWRSACNLLIMSPALYQKAIPAPQCM